MKDNKLEHLKLKNFRTNQVSNRGRKGKIPGGENLAYLYNCQKEL